MTSEKDREEIVIRNKPLIYKVIKDMNLYWETEDEFENYFENGLIGLIKGINLYDSSKYKESTFLYPCIKNEIGHYITLKNMPKRFNKNGKDVSLNTLIDEEKTTEFGDFLEDTNVDIEKDIESKLEVERLLYAINNCLTKIQKKYICQYYGLNGYVAMKMSEIAEISNCSKSNVGYVINRAKEKLKIYLIKNDREVFMIKEEKKVMQVNQSKPIKQNDLNKILFEQLSRLNDSSLDLDKEIRKSYAITQVAQQIINNNNTYLKAARLIGEQKIKDSRTLAHLGFNTDVK